MIAALGMYDMPQVQAANDRYWRAIRDGLRARGQAAPEALTRGDAAFWPAWEAPDLVFSQTCGYPFRSRLHGRVTLIGTPDFGVPGCPPGYYCSVFIVRKGDERAKLKDFSGARFAYNHGLSQSGWAAPQNFGRVSGVVLPPSLATGGHLQSALAVTQGLADIAAIDAVTWAMLTRWLPETGQLKELDRTDPTPGLPYIAAAGADADVLFAATEAAIAGLAAADRDILMLKGVVRIAATAYLAVPNPPTPDQMARNF